MKKNRGHARCNAFAIRHLSKDDDFEHLIVMDGDGEDRPEEIKMLVEKAFSHEGVSVVAKRIKRSEGPLFQMLYQMHKIITLIFTGKNVNFGNYSCLTKNDVRVLATKESLWSSFSGSVKKNLKHLNKAFEEINTVEVSLGELELIAEKLKLAQRNVAMVLDNEDDDRVLSGIFSNFCIGK